MNTTDALLRGILATVGRKTFPPDLLYKLVAPTADNSKQVLAYNLCNGQTPQNDICKQAKIDSGNFSRTINKWIEAGIVIRIGPDDLPLHVYVLPAQKNKPTKKAA